LTVNLSTSPWALGVSLFSLLKKQQIIIIPGNKNQWLFMGSIEYNGIPHFSSYKQTTLFGSDIMKLMLRVLKKERAVTGIQATGLWFQAKEISGQEYIIQSVPV
jgi:hypothetical protein